MLKHCLLQKEAWWLTVVILEDLEDLICILKSEINKNVL